MSNAPTCKRGGVFHRKGDRRKAIDGPLSAAINGERPGELLHIDIKKLARSLALAPPREDVFALLRASKPRRASSADLEALAGRFNRAPDGRRQ